MCEGHRFTRILLLLVIVLSLLTGTFNTLAKEVNYKLTEQGLIIENIHISCPMIYDNDWWGDTPDKNYLWAKASLGKINLRANIVTRDMWNWRKGYLYKLEQGVKDARKSIGIARRSGLKNIPDAIPGCDKAFQRPKSNKVEDTKVVRTKGSDLIVTEARKANPKKPLLIFVGGPLNTVANAYLTDPSIADRMIVFMTDLRGYNGKDPWANYIVANRCRLINFGAQRIWWPQRPKPPVMPLDRFKQLPQNEQTRELHRIAKNFWDRSTQRKTRDDGFADGAPIFLVFRPESWVAIQKQKVTGVFSLRDVDKGPWDLLDARKCDFGVMQKEFFDTLSNPAAYRPKE